jgi:clan AA aspartic protease
VITGAVNAARREARVGLIVRGGEGIMIEVEAVLDTGFTEHLSLPQTSIDHLRLPFVRKEDSMLSDGGIIECDIYSGVVIWDGQERTIEIQASEGDPLLGMSLLLHHLVTLPVIDGGLVTIAALS